MKKVITVALAIIMLFAVTACGSKKEAKAVSEIMAQVRKEIEFPEMAEISKTDIVGYYDIDTASIEDMALIIAGGGATADEVLILKMADGTDMDAVTAKMDVRLKMQTDLFSTYNPDESTKLSSAVVKSKGNYAFLAITNDNSKAEKIFNEAV